MDNELNIFLNSLPNVQGKKIYVFGTGNTAQLYQEGFKRLANFNIEGYLNNNAVTGQIFAGKSVCKPGEIVAKENVCVLICSPQPSVYSEVGRQLTELGIEWHHIDAAIWGMNKEKVVAAYESFDDEDSRELYFKLLKCRISCELPSADMITRPQYFCLPQFMMRDAGEVFIDCGAFVGDSVERYIWEHDGIFKKIIAFEPDTINFKAMQKRVERLNEEWNLKKKQVDIYPFAVGAEDTISYVNRLENNNGLGSSVSDKEADGADKVETISLDSFFNEQYTFLKADIESYEYKLLLGAKKSIKKWQPKIAICIYHNAIDFYSIPLLLKEINPNYKFKLYHHAPAHDDTVLYAYI